MYLYNLWFVFTIFKIWKCLSSNVIIFLRLTQICYIIFKVQYFYRLKLLLFCSSHNHINKKKYYIIILTFNTLTDERSVFSYWLTFKFIHKSVSKLWNTYMFYPTNIIVAHTLKSIVAIDNCIINLLNVCVKIKSIITTNFLILMKTFAYIVSLNCI